MDASSGDASQGLPPEACAAAGSAAQCTAIQLEELTDCADCWHSCAWLVLHEVERDGDTCTYGETSGQCVYRHGGEESGFDLSQACLLQDWALGHVWVDSSGPTAKVGYLESGYIQPRTLLESCYGEGAVPECECPCLPGYPDAECRQFDQEWRSGVASGVELCPGIPHHRVSEPTCNNDLTHHECTSETGTCQQDSECGAGESCLQLEVACSCIKLCETDADCASDEACVCRGSTQFSQCVPAECNTDADCSTDQVCGLSFGATHTSGGCQVEGLACRDPYVNCNGVLCPEHEMCAYDATNSEWACVENDRCSQFFP